MVRADSKREQFGRHDAGTNGVRFLMKLFHQISAALKAVNHLPPRTVVASSKILLERGSGFACVMEQCGKIRSIFQAHRPQAFCRPPRRTAQVLPQRLPNDLSALRFPLMRVALHLITNSREKSY